MLVVDVMRRLNSEHEIRFLLSAYLETLQFYGPEKYLPPGVALLPLKDADDIEARFNNLLGEELNDLARTSCGTRGAIAREVTEIFGAACARMQVLRDKETTFRAH
jgi:hypothetical protein